MTVKDAAKIVLKASNEPLNAQQIAQRILDQGLWKTEGKTPDQTVAANLYMDIKKHGDGSAFRIASRGKFALNAVSTESDAPQQVIGTQVYSFTKCAVAGAILGTKYGLSSIPHHWVQKVRHPSGTCLQFTKGLDIVQIGEQLADLVR
ncbi:winged helix-turn-helix domain-containing protein [Sphaerochaeta sp. UBA5849]|jgi:hypothetical protein|uniref:winged helix-turn-helix domain-containing protein n=1 Tax=Sphaerochaeta sp. UBA5849 TaxID=1947475 RepID=UPI0031F5D4BD